MNIKIVLEPSEESGFTAVIAGMHQRGGHTRRRAEKHPGGDKALLGTC